jgi:hypothetical protein
VKKKKTSSATQKPRPKNASCRPRREITISRL